MHRIKIIETAMSICGYSIDQIKYANKSREVRKIIGFVPVVKKVVINGKSRLVKNLKKFRWDANGRCFSFYSNVRERKYDLPIQTVVEDMLRKDTETKM